MQTHRMNMMVYQTATSSAGGLLAFVFKPTDVTQAADWSSLTASFEEYRVVAYEVRYLPFADGAYNTTLAPASGCVATAHISNEVLPSTVSSVTQHDTWSPWYSYREKVIVWRARSTEELQWLVNSTTNDAGAIIGAIEDVSASKSYGRFVVTYVVEFRGRR